MERAIIWALSMVVVALALLVVVLTAEVALADASLKLIGNLEQVQQPGYWEDMGRHAGVPMLLKRKFRIGSNAGGYIVSEVTAYLDAVGSDNESIVRVYASLTNGGHSAYTGSALNFLEHDAQYIHRPRRSSLRHNAGYFVDSGMMSILRARPTSPDF